ncbi:MAG TPA: DUF924 family protein [Gammaproteobacteria bacterium]|nr:DUF924 family protein [Gammaproteobacteria bacterium]
MSAPTAEPAAQPEAILAYWFGEPAQHEAEVDAHMRRWFGGGAGEDASLAERFGAAVAAASTGELDSWAVSARGRLALILLLDQFPRNLHRGTRLAFAQDAKALALTLTGIESGLDRMLTPLERMFFYMPMQHAESLEIQERGVLEFARLADTLPTSYLRNVLAGSADYAKQHRDIIARFGRFPHRNEALGRQSTPAEAAYLAQGAPKFGQ